MKTLSQIINEASMIALSQIINESYMIEASSFKVGDKIRTIRGKKMSGVITKIQGSKVHFNHSSETYKSSFSGSKAKPKQYLIHISNIQKEEALKEDEYRTKSGAYKKGARDKSSDLPKKYASGLTNDEEEKQKKEFDKRKKMSDDDPDAYELTAQDKEYKDTEGTKQSQHTKKYKELYSEERIKGLEKKSDETGIAYSILKKVYDRGMAAWKTGHRPGTTPQQWAFARVNSFVTGGKTQKTTDKDLWDQVKKSKNESVEQIQEAEYQGKTVTLDKPFRTPGEDKKFAVYVKNDKGNVIKLGFGDPGMEIKRDDDDKRASFRARHHCDDPQKIGPKWKARYWSCKFWEKGKSVTDLLEE